MKDGMAGKRQSKKPTWMDEGKDAGLYLRSGCWRPCCFYIQLKVILVEF